MNEHRGGDERPEAAGGPLSTVFDTLRSLSTDVDDAARVDLLRALEEMKGAVAAAQARVTVAFVDSQREANAAAGVKPERAEIGIAHQVGLAMRISPHRAHRHVRWSQLLTCQLPATFAELQAGRTSEYRSVLVAREAAWLPAADRAVLDGELAPRLESLGDRRTEAEAKKIAYRLDPAGYVDRARYAEADRRVGVRPAPDSMARLTALLPVPQAVGCFAALGRAADTVTGTGDPRSRGQVMADTLVERLTGQATADATPVEVQLVMPADTLFEPEPAETESTRPAADDTQPADTDEDPDGEPPAEPGTDAEPGTEPAWLTGYGPVPGPWARELVLHGTAPRWIRRLYTCPDTGELVGMDSRRRLFTQAQRRFVLARDQVCRTPWCEAPIRHIDHILPAAEGGKTRIANGQGLCQGCNHAKQAPGWWARPGPSRDVSITTPTGHRYRSHPPDLTWHPRSPLEARLEVLLRGAVA